MTGEIVELDDWDRGTTLEVMEDGKIHLQLPMLPPSWWDEEEELDFAGELAAAIGVGVEPDGVRFVIPEPRADTIRCVQELLRELRARYPSRG